MLPSRVTEKWAIKRNTWENRRDSTEAQVTYYFFFPGWPSYLTNWQRYSLMMEKKSNRSASSSFTEDARVYLAICLKTRIHQIKSLLSCCLTFCCTVTIPSSNKLPIPQRLPKDVIRLESRWTQRKHSETFSYVTETSTCIIFVFTCATARVY